MEKLSLGMARGSMKEEDPFSSKAIYKDFVVCLLTGATLCVIIDYINHTYFAS